MAKSSHALQSRQSDDLKPELKENNQGFKNETEPRQALRVLHCLGEAVPSLGVSSQQINKWLNGDKIPEGRVIEIAEIVRSVFLRELLGIREWSERLIYSQFGRQRGHASRGGYV